MEIINYSGEKGNNSHCTAMISGSLSAKKIEWLKGKNDEQTLFEKSKSGRYTLSDWDNFLADVKINGIKDPILIVVEQNTFDCNGRIINFASPKIFEGSHRLQAAIQLGIDIKVDIRIFGHANHQKLMSLL